VRRTVNRPTVHEDDAVVRLENARHDAEQRGGARAGHADEKEDLPLFDAQRDTAERAIRSSSSR